MQVSGPDAVRHDRAIAWGLLLVQVSLLAVVFLSPVGSAWATAAWLVTCARVLSAGGAVLVVVGILNLGRSATPLPTPVQAGALRSHGLYRWVRHPIYTGVILLAVGSAIPSGSIPVAIATVALVAWLQIKARWEERRLAARYPDYAAYAARTPRFIPFLRGPRSMRRRRA